MSTTKVANPTGLGLTPTSQSVPSLETMSVPNMERAKDVAAMKTILGSGLMTGGVSLGAVLLAGALSRNAIANRMTQPQKNVTTPVPHSTFKAKVEQRRPVAQANPELEERKRVRQKFSSSGEKEAGFGGDFMSMLKNFKPTEALESGLGAISDNVLQPLRDEASGLGGLAAGSPGQPFLAYPWFAPALLGSAAAGGIGGGVVANSINRTMHDRMVKDKLDEAEDRYLDALADLHIRKTAGATWTFSKEAEAELHKLYEKYGNDPKGPLTALWDFTMKAQDPGTAAANVMGAKSEAPLTNDRPWSSFLSPRDETWSEHSAVTDALDTARAFYFPYAATSFAVPAALSAYYTHQFVKDRAKANSTRNRIERAMKLRKLEQEKYSPDAGSLILK